MARSKQRTTRKTSTTSQPAPAAKPKPTTDTPTPETAPMQTPDTPAAPDQAPPADFNGVKLNLDPANASSTSAPTPSAAPVQPAATPGAPTAAQAPELTATPKPTPAAAPTNGPAADQPMPGPSDTTNQAPEIAPALDPADVPPAPAYTDLDTFCLIVPGVPTAQPPSHPKNMTLSLNGDRRRKLHALRDALQADRATIHARRGGASGEQLVMTFNDAVLWLLDQVEVNV